MTGRADVVYTNGEPEVKDGACTENMEIFLRRFRGRVGFSRDKAARLGFAEPASQIVEPPDEMSAP